MYSVYTCIMHTCTCTVIISPCTQVTLMHSGSCGAFVHSLEDEYMEVRSAAVKSMGQLCAVSPGFATLSLDYLVDMFNDEIESVRLLAINCLRQV